MFSEADRKVAETHCLESWFIVDFHFKRVQNNPNYVAIYGLIQECRSRGYDRQLEASTDHGSLDLCPLRRTIRQLQRQDPWIRFRVHQGVMTVHFRAENVNVMFEIDRVEITQEVENLLTLLVAYPIVARDAQL